MTTELVPMEFLNRIKLKLLANYMNYVSIHHTYQFTNKNEVTIHLGKVEMGVIEIIVRKDE